MRIAKIKIEGVEATIVIPPQLPQVRQEGERQWKARR
jgi:hypothetical protein